MGLSKALRFTCGVSIVVVCFGAFLCFLPTRLYVPTALGSAHSHPLDRGAEQGYLAVAQEEAGQADRDPVNADLLRMLVLAVSTFLGLSFGWLLTNTQRQGVLGSSGVVGDRLAGACKDQPFLGVFRL
jgi:hypothetical protein